MKTILIIAAALMSLQTHAQNYYLKQTTIQKYNESGTYYTPFQDTHESGFVRLEKRQLITRAYGRQQRVYSLHFEPIPTSKGLFFTAEFRGRVVEVWYNLKGGYLLIQSGAYLRYYRFNKEV